MDSLEVEESFFAASDAKLHGGMCKTFSSIHCKVLTVFPELEAARPRSKSGIQALCSLHLALDKAKSILQHCSQCSKLYLAITGDSVLQKFEKARSALVDSLRRVEDIVPQSIGSQINEIVDELEATELLLDPSEKQIGDDIIALLQEGTSFSSCSDTNELESFYQAATKLGIASSRGALIERRALKKLIDRARAEEDKRKESIVAYLLHLMRKYSKLFRTEFSEDTDSQGSAPCSPTVQSSFENGRAFDRQFSKLSSFNFRPAIRRSGQVPTAPEELRCPISLQLMFDPVVIASGQTYERICIEKWFGDGHGTCPKTQQMLPHLFLTPNYCVKGLVSSWCEHNGVLPPVGPPDSLDFNYWRLALSESEAANSRSVESVGSCQLKDVNVVALEESCTIEEEASNYEMRDVLERHEEFLNVLTGHDDDLVRKCEVVEQIRVLLKDDEEARMFMGANGFVEALLRFLEAGLRQGNLMAQEVGAMALFNLAVDNNRNKELMLAAQVIPLLEDMISNQTSKPSAIALYLNLSFLEEAKPVIGSSPAVPFLSDTLTDDSESQCKLDALQTLYNLSTHKPSIQTLLSSDLIPALQSFLANSADPTWTEKSIAVLLNLASTPSGKEEMTSSTDLIGTLATVLDTGGPTEQEQAVVCLFVLCNGNDKCIQMVLQEGVIPALVSVSVNGSVRGKEKAQKLLLLFREQRQRDQSSQHHQADKEKETSLDRTAESQTMSVVGHDSKPYCKAVSRRKIMKGWSFLRRHKSSTVS